MRIARAFTVGVAVCAVVIVGGVVLAGVVSVAFVEVRRHRQAATLALASAPDDPTAPAAEPHLGVRQAIFEREQREPVGLRNLDR